MTTWLPDLFKKAIINGFPKIYLGHRLKQASNDKLLFNKLNIIFLFNRKSKIVNEYDQEIPQSQTADNPVAPRRRAAQPSRDTRKTN